MRYVQRAQWLRDTGNQFAPLYKVLPQDDNLKALVKAIINTESRYIAQYPYCSEWLSIRAQRRQKAERNVEYRLLSAATREWPGPQC